MPIRTMPHCSRKERDREVRLRPHDGDSETERQAMEKINYRARKRKREGDCFFLVGGKMHYAFARSEKD